MPPLGDARRRVRQSDGNTLRWHREVITEQSGRAGWGGCPPRFPTSRSWRGSGATVFGSLRWQRCRVHFICNALAHVGKGRRQAVLAMTNTVLVQETAEAAIIPWRGVADQLRQKFPELASMMDSTENKVRTFMSFPRVHRTQIHITNPLESLNAEVKRRTNAIDTFPNDRAVIRLVGALIPRRIRS